MCNWTKNAWWVTVIEAASVWQSTVIVAWEDKINRRSIILIIILMGSNCTEWPWGTAACSSMTQPLFVSCLAFKKGFSWELTLRILINHACLPYTKHQTPNLTSAALMPLSIAFLVQSQQIVISCTLNYNKPESSVGPHVCFHPFPVQTDSDSVDSCSSLPLLPSALLTKFGPIGERPIHHLGAVQSQGSQCCGPTGGAFYYKMEIQVQYLHSPYPAELV